MMLAVLIWVAGLFLAFQLRVSTDISALMPQHSRLSGALLQALEDFGASDRLLVVIEAGETAPHDLIDNRRKLKELAGQVATGMEASGLFSSVAYRVTPGQREFFENLYFRYPFHYHSPESWHDLQARLAPDAMERQVIELARTLRVSPFGASSQQQMLRDPLGFRSDRHSGSDQESLTGLRLDLSDGYFFSVDSSLILIIAQPREPSQDTVFDALVIDTLEQLLADLGDQERFRADYSITIGQGFEAQLLGPYVETLYGSRAAQKELLPSIIVTALGLLILFAVVYRSGRMLMVLAIPLVTGILMASGVASLFAGHLTMITVGFAAMLAGLGIDFEIHLVERIGQEATKTGDLRQSIATAFASSGRGVLAGALTTAAIFGLIATSDFAALQEFGWIIGLGILLTMIAIFALLPALMVTFPPPFHPRRSVGEMAWAAWIVCHCRLVTLLGLVLTLILGWSATRLELASNIYELGPMNTAYETEKDRIMQTAGGSTNVVMLVSESPDLQALLERSEEMTATLLGLKASGQIASFESLSTLLPSERSQYSRAQEVHTWGLDAAMLSFRETLADGGFRLAPFEPFIGNVLGYQSTPGKLIELEDLKGTPAESMLDRYLVQKDGSWKMVAYLYPHSGSWEAAVPAEIIDTFEGQDNGTILTGIVPVFNEIASTVREEFLRLTLAALVIVLLISLFFFKRPLLSIVSAIPAVLGLIWTLGLMNLAGIELNLITMLVAPLIVGLGIDDALHVLNRQQEKPSSLVATLSAVSPAILMTTATTIIGFGSLALAELPSLQALGLTVSIGMLCCAATSLLLLPALLTIFETRK